MVGSLVRKLNGIKNNWQPSYIRYGCLPIAEKTVLLEGGQGSNINGNMFALVKELATNPAFMEYQVVLAVTKQTLAKAKERLAFYGCRRVEMTIRNSKAYCKYLATAKYLFTDNTFPPYFHKRHGQVYCNTWHGTPLKTLGFANKETLHSVNNIQKNFLAADYALFPNEFTRQVFMKDYALEHIFRGQSVVANYPRNGVFYNPQAGQELKKRLGYQGKRLYAYMPTFRENSAAQLNQIRSFLQEWDARLDDNSHLLINLHFVLASELDCKEFKHVSYFPKEYETYDVLNACDGLVTDYSSVFFDFAVTRKPIVLFAYDKEEYLQNRGTYFPLESLPFPLAYKVEEVFSHLQNPLPVPQKFLETFCGNGSENSAWDLLSLVLDQQPRKEPEKSVCLVYANGLKQGYYESLQHLIAENLERHFVVTYRGNVSKELLELSRLFQGRVTLLGLMNAFQFTPFQRLMLTVDKKGSSKILQQFYRREAARLFGGIAPEKVVDLSANHPILAGVLNCLSGEKFTVEHSGFLPPLSCRKVQKKEKQMGFSCISHGAYETQWLAKHTDVLQEVVTRGSFFKPILPLYLNCGKKMVCLSLFRYQTTAPVSAKGLQVQVGERTAPLSCLWGKKLKKKGFGICKFSIPLAEALTLPAKNTVTVSYVHPLGESVSFPMTYCAMPRNLFVGLRGPMAVDKATQTVAVFRQSLENHLMIYVRSVNVTDKVIQRLKQTVAYGVSLLWHTKKAKSLILLFEKNGSKYEESASVLYEELLKGGYTNGYFVLTKDSPYLPRVGEQYRGNLVYKYTFRHYLYFFKAKTFIGTEAIPHAIDLKTFNLLPLKKVVDKRINYVFLQHGVMYMVSLDSESRGMFARKNLKGKYRVVVSSRKEAQHFTTLGRHLPEDMYITGLPKFDRNTHAPGADKIVIMPTWRPWEINRARENFAGTGYCQMMMALYENLPESLQKKTVILPHPLVSNGLQKLPKEITEKMVLDRPYDEILQETAVLITDYSSIAYDAFYRGARVIFDWSEKDACMQEYGPSTKLMLHEGNVFGDVIFAPQQLGDIIEENYHAPQREEYQKRYETLVEFQDGKNTRRLIDCLKKDGIL